MSEGYFAHFLAFYIFIHCGIKCYFETTKPIFYMKLFSYYDNFQMKIFQILDYILWNWQNWKKHDVGLSLSELESISLVEVIMVRISVIRPL